MQQSILEERVRGEIFLDADEKLLCVAGSHQLDSFLEKGKQKKSFAVLSDRAVYCKGKCVVSRDRRFYQTKQTDFRLDLEEFKDIKILPQRNQILLTLAFFFLLLGPTLLLLDKLTNYGENIVLNPTLDAVICLLAAGVFFLRYSIHQKTLLELIHTNGSIGLDQGCLPQKEERLLLRYLRAFLNSRNNPQPSEEEIDLDEMKEEIQPKEE